jgi:hypothetical protein
MQLSQNDACRDLRFAVQVRFGGNIKWHTIAAFANRLAAQDFAQTITRHNSSIAAFRVCEVYQRDCLAA